VYTVLIRTHTFGSGGEVAARLLANAEHTTKDMQTILLERSGALPGGTSMGVVVVPLQMREDLIVVAAILLAQ
jgi:hypothetical protein